MVLIPRIIEHNRGIGAVYHGGTDRMRISPYRNEAVFVAIFERLLDRLGKIYGPVGLNGFKSA